MNKIAQGLIAATAAILLLAGCSAVSAEAQGVPTPSASSEPSGVPSSTPSAAPVTIEPTANTDPSSNQWNGFPSQREWYLRSLDGALSGTVSDDQLIAAGMLACDQLKGGTSLKAVRVVTQTGPAADLDNRNIVGSAVEVYCPQFG